MLPASRGYIISLKLFLDKKRDTSSPGACAYVHIMRTHNYGAHRRIAFSRDDSRKRERLRL